MKTSKAYKVIGRPEARIDGEEKVTGKAVYAVDVELPGMAHGKILRSPYPHARLLRVEWQQGRKASRSLRGHYQRGSTPARDVRRGV